MRNRIAAMFMAAMTGMAAMLTPEGMVINEGNAPYVALGSDLTEDEREEVLELLELEPEQLTEPAKPGKSRRLPPGRRRQLPAGAGQEERQRRKRLPQNRKERLKQKLL